MNKEKQKAVAEFVAQTNKEHGEVATTGRTVSAVESITTGSLAIDRATGIWGIPKGRITEVMGEESSCKTTLALHSVAAIQKEGGSALYIDAEHALDSQYCKNLGVDLDSLVICQPNTAEDSMGIVKTALTAVAFDLIVVDSIAGMVPRAILEGEMGDAHMSVLARLLSKALPQFSGLCHNSNTALLLLNQMRAANFGGYGPTKLPCGGNAPKFYASLRISMTRSTLKKDGEDVIGNTVKVKVIKNKLAAPFKECEPEVYYGEGFSRESDIIDIGVAEGALEKAGSWYSFNGERLGQGKETLRQLLLAQPDLAAKIEAEIKVRIGLSPA